MCGHEILHHAAPRVPWKDGASGTMVHWRHDSSSGKDMNRISDNTLVTSCFVSEHVHSSSLHDQEPMNIIITYTLGC